MKWKDKIDVGDTPFVSLLSLKLAFDYIGNEFRDRNKTCHFQVLVKTKQLGHLVRIYRPSGIWTHSNPPARSVYSSQTDGACLYLKKNNNKNSTHRSIIDS